MPSRRPLRSLSGFEMVLHGFTYVRLSARLCRRYGGASGRAEQGATGWGRGGSGCPHCVRDDYGGQRERSRITRAAVPYCPAPDVSRSVIRCPAGRPAASCVRPLWWTAELSTSRQTPGERIHHRCQARADRHPAPVVRQLSCSGRSVLQAPAHAGAQVFALLPRG